MNRKTKVYSKLIFLIYWLLLHVCIFAEIPHTAIYMRFAGANPSASAMPLSSVPVESIYFKETKPKGPSQLFSELIRSYYLGVYPGIDLVCFTDNYTAEYVFSLGTGSDVELIQIETVTPHQTVFGTDGRVTIYTDNNAVLLEAPVVFVTDQTGTKRTNARYRLGAGERLGIDIPEWKQNKTGRVKELYLNIVPCGGQPNGPKYNFYISKYEITNEQFLQFLNDAQSAGTNNPHGTNMFFDETGNVWINPEMHRQRDEMFVISASKLLYNPNKALGSRYDHTRSEGNKAIHASEPVTGVSWFGAVKFCNWLTLEAGRGLADRCYTEGTNTLDWAPVTATNWISGEFKLAERELWLSLRGFRLPMVNCNYLTVTNNPYNEFYKASAWSGNTNRFYGFGRDSCEPSDANFFHPTFPEPNKITPVGFYDGLTRVGKLLTRPNANFFGLFDMSGNVGEWCTDFALEGNVSSRIVMGGAWLRKPEPINVGASMYPHAADMATGFRIATTYMPVQTATVHLVIRLQGEPIAKFPAPTVEAELPEIPLAVTYEQVPVEKILPAIDITASLLGTERVQPEGLLYKYCLTVTSINPESNVPITIVPSDLQGASSGHTPFARWYEPGTVVTLTAPETAGERNNFRRWLMNGQFYSTERTVTVRMTSDIVMTAVYVPSYVLTVTSLNPSRGISIQNATTDLNGRTDGVTPFVRVYDAGTVVRLIAPATEPSGGEFQYWLMNGREYSRERSVTVVMNSDIVMTAVYGLTRRLTVLSINPNSGVNITVRPQDVSGGTDGSTPFARIYQVGTVVTLIAPSAVGNAVFVQWLRDGSPYSSANRVTVRIESDTVMTAVFRYRWRLDVRSSAPNSGVPITISPSDLNGNGNGTTSFARIYTDGTIVTLVAPLTAGVNTFWKWQRDGVDYSFNRTVNVLMTTNHMMRAIYRYVPGPIPDPEISPAGL